MPKMHEALVTMSDVLANQGRACDPVSQSGDTMQQILGAWTENPYGTHHHRKLEHQSTQISN